MGLGKDLNVPIKKAAKTRAKTKIYFCQLCGIELDVHDLDANLTTWGVFKSVCSDCVHDADEYPNLLED